MSTKYLARTVIEGGRYYFNCWERRQSSKVERTRVREELRQLCTDPAAWDGLALTPRKPVHKSFRDKLAPAYRFLSSRANKSWNESYALLRERFDDRTTAGRHILFDHLLRSIEHDGEAHHSPWISRWGRFVVDKDDVLRKVTRPRRKRRPSDALSLSCRIAGFGLRNRLRLVRLQAGRPIAPCPARLQAPVSEAGCSRCDSEQGGEVFSGREHALRRRVGCKPIAHVASQV